jgi:hypothetical protein
MINSIQCSTCQTFDIKESSVYYGRNHEFLGEWPLYMFGAKPTEPMNADHYFCGVYCANIFHRAQNVLTK